MEKSPKMTENKHKEVLAMRKLMILAIKNAKKAWPRGTWAMLGADIQDAFVAKAILELIAGQDESTKGWGSKAIELSTSASYWRNLEGCKK